MTDTDDGCRPKVKERWTSRSKGGETKLPRKKPGTRNIFDCVGWGEHTAWRILLQSTEGRRGILETSFCRRANAVFERNRNRMARSTRFQGGASECDQRKHSETVIFSRLVVRWKKTDTGHKAKSKWCVHGFKDLDIHEIERSCQTVVQHYTADPGVDHVRRDVDPRGKAFMQGDPSVRDEPLYATSPHQKLPGVLVGAPIRLDRDVFGFVSGMSGWRSRIVSQ